MGKMEIYSLPTYDHNTDTFKDGPLPKNVDAYFTKSKEMAKYYSDTETQAAHQ